jgi:hypothetical protein
MNEGFTNFSKKIYTFKGQKGKNTKNTTSPKTAFGAQNQYGRVIYPSIGNFTCSKKKYTLGDQKGENEPSDSEPKISMVV